MQLAFGVLLVVLLTELINLIGKTHFTAMVHPPAVLLLPSSLGHAPQLENVANMDRCCFFIIRHTISI